ncbi:MULTISPECIES: type IV toxin-antitoxin system AbiEi family antitoxin domain-containing protein [Micromonospora]|uniref:AbiEi antitoxin N-terminal domain-containing protein n=1 Tax=Micromonospora solifontis TaxID=2487138 RepID=A0ABX9WJ67_9ACTN|nr:MULTISPECIES: type IV toxin-antitoxin system AbiEi family antitoxin domain-containing protein [Micromonospora]NES14447.1 hypothetical protein [Micromonospora sp. PPF5-17B]NES36764.1 hypothetical protein [Micromonospora solifontis]NES56378.1 hypothetical protein [Micromonospora sp. PPF5-6]RNL99134.1 hypothetical protein EFE23_11440 [Micromonospora solifontis]
MNRRDLISEVAAQQDGIVTRRQALEAGFTRHEIDNFVMFGRWRRLARATYLVDPSLAAGAERLSRIRAAVLSCGPHAHAVLATAAELHGIGGLRRAEAIHVALPGRAARPTRVKDPAVVLHQFEHPDDALTWIGDIPTTTALRTVAALILRERRYPAISLLDSALNRQLVSEDELLSVPALLRGRRGAVAARGYLAEANGLAQSPLETRARLRCVDGKIPPDALQIEIRDDDGYLLGIGDLGWRAARVVAEADGRGPHATPQALFDDRRRQNRFVNAGWTVLRFTWSDTLRPDYIPAVVRGAIAARAVRRS